MRLNYVCLLIVGIFSMILVGCSSGDTQADGEAGVKLDGNVELIVPASTGGGSDINARILAETIKENDLIDRNIMVVNKPGGSTAVAHSYVYNKSGANNTILTWNSSQIISPIINQNNITLEDFTPLGTLTLDSYLLVVNNDSPFDSFEELIDYARENPDTVTIGGTGQGTELHILSHLINKFGETELKYIPFDSGGESLASLLGNHIDVNLANPNEVQSQIEAGQLKALVSSSSERLSGVLSDVPTFEELGYGDIQVTSFRGYVGPPDLTDEEIAFWEDVLKKAHETEKWQKDYVERYELTSEYLNAKESEVYYQEVFDMYYQAAVEMGLIE
ncbi:tripartite tricarboxylate transporter substrate binding protein [Alkalihalobacillus sp. 1P02AB]|uniref:tripartite tricarboxylate transporter substrate binding protein n=1 Tax=Alkalihalobacillus sp. 1P02AB TaxID=3132260 RepID=UPI0039A4424B